MHARCKTLRHHGLDEIVSKNTFASGTDAGRKYPTTQAGAALAWQDTGTSDIRLTVTASAATNEGLVRFTILYQQNNNLA